MKVTSVVAMAIIACFFAWGTRAEEQKQDSPLVRFARMVSRNDAETVALAASLAANKEKAWEIPTFSETVGFEFGPNDLNSATALLWFVTHKTDLPFIGYFDWKDGGTTVTDVLDHMLAHEKLAGPSTAERAAILKEAEDNFRKYTALPVLTTRYDRYFRSKGYSLAHIATNSDAYFLIVLPPETARCWLNTMMPLESGFRPNDMPLVQQAIDQAGDFIKDKATDMLPLLTPQDRKPRDIPAADCPSP